MASKVAKIGLAVPVAIGNLLTRGIEKITGKKYGTTKLEEAASTKFGKTLGTAITLTGAAAAGAAAIANPAIVATAAKKVGSSLIPKTLGGAVKTAIVAPIAIGALAKSKTARKTVASALDPVKNIERGKTAGQALEDFISGKSDLGTTLKNVAGAGLIVGGAVGAGVLIKKAVDKVKELKSKKAITEEQAAEAENILTSSTGQSPTEIYNPVEAAGLAAPYTITPETSALYGTPTLSEPLQSTNATPPIQNIIQIAVR